jgi:hypothetical protein
MRFTATHGMGRRASKTPLDPGGPFLFCTPEASAEMATSSFRGTAQVLIQTYGTASAAVAAERAEERFANIDVGGFAYWKNVETFIRSVLGQNA